MNLYSFLSPLFVALSCLARWPSAGFHFFFFFFTPMLAVGFSISSDVFIMVTILFMFNTSRETMLWLTNTTPRHGVRHWCLWFYMFMLSCLGTHIWLYLSASTSRKRSQSNVSEKAEHKLNIGFKKIYFFYFLLFVFLYILNIYINHIDVILPV